MVDITDIYRMRNGVKKIRRGNNSVFHSTISPRLERKWLDRNLKRWVLFLFLLLCYFFHLFVSFSCFGFGFIWGCFPIELWSFVIEFFRKLKITPRFKEENRHPWKSTDRAAIKHSSPSVASSSALPVILTAGKLSQGDHNALFTHPRLFFLHSSGHLLQLLWKQHPDKYLSWSNILHLYIMRGKNPWKPWLD